MQCGEDEACPVIITRGKWLHAEDHYNTPDSVHDMSFMIDSRPDQRKLAVNSLTVFL